MIRRLLYLCLLLHSLSTFCQTFDTDTIAPQAVPAGHRFSPRQLVLPGALVAAGTTGLFQPVMAWKYELQDAVHTLGGQDRFPFEDYVQYVPALAAVSAGWLGVRAEHETADRLMLSATSYAVTAGLTWALLKRTVVSIRPGIHYTYVASGRQDEITPDANPKYFNSFPSGHSATAFMGAELVRLEYGREHPWLAVGAYAVATGVGVMRIYHDYHWFTDVLAGAGMGILGARIGWWLLPYERRLFHSLFKNDIAIRPSTDGSGAVLALSLSL